MKSAYGTKTVVPQVPRDYDFLNGQGVGPFQEQPGDVDGNKDGGNGLKDTDGGTPTNEADAGGFPGTGEPNEPGVNGAIDPVDIDVTKRLQPAGIGKGRLEEGLVSY
ncbi:hypothetical protein HPB48_017235 [Haemaphysalis longicornis]|uniref:Uncharacterized protein n=1 Tax=Haemaphysalis longicornis TaxID=44386 RepID=A0A9J6H2W4_HAELO|nr:hypothetical protein HPB48_017235 [Haemaphysalis longicornis]